MDINSISASALNQLNAINNQLLSAMNRLSTGNKINRPSDDPAGYYSAKALEKDIRTAEVESRTAEREQNAARTESTKLDSAADMVQEIEMLGHEASSPALSQGERDAIQNEIELLSSQLDQSLQKNGLGSASDLGLTAENLVINETAKQRQTALSSTQNAFTSIVSQNADKGTEVRELSRQQEILGSTIVDLKSSLSSVKDTNMINEIININNLTTLQKIAIQGISTSQNVQKSQLDLFA